MPVLALNPPPPQPSPQPTLPDKPLRNPTIPMEGCVLDEVGKCEARCDEWFTISEEQYSECNTCAAKTLSELGFVPGCWDTCSHTLPSPVPTVPPAPTPLPTPPPHPDYEEVGECEVTDKDEAVATCSVLYEKDQELYSLCSPCIEGNTHGNVVTCFDPCLPPNIHTREERELEKALAAAGEGSGSGDEGEYEQRKQKQQRQKNKLQEGGGGQEDGGSDEGTA